ncbi:hypothetical protein [Caldisalinibacter kiritimatiensis]|uniref:Uncharacterized protein n=1 Tax=Caldisalinibacter kiritimatiensis TaxID=1304284 RepID=R1CDF8_9FIRM|nr:hypothetical protein [Caldisalinibacter kiritimatiensis]EOD00325.1 hypothetical protein L21TH_1624 [Caldisalinibacter kiritimatiensis]
MNTEIIKEIVPKFFEVGFYNQKYYDIVVTDKRIILAWMGETYRPWMLRVDPGMYKRKEFEKLNIDDVVNYNEKNVIIDYEDIEKVELKKRTFFKNGYIYIKTKNNEFKLYNKDKKLNYDDLLMTLQGFMGKKVIFNES